jgi:DNA-binding GntR family transcriptional regulator
VQSEFQREYHHEARPDDYGALAYLIRNFVYQWKFQSSENPNWTRLFGSAPHNYGSAARHRTFPRRPHIRVATAFLGAKRYEELKLCIFNSRSHIPNGTLRLSDTSRQQHAGLGKPAIANPRRTEIDMNYPRIDVKPLETDSRYGIKAYKALKQAITEMDIYSHPGEVRLEERQLSELLGVSRTPIREAMTVLEHEGFVRSMPRRGIFVVRKTKKEILEMITVWAALESMAARLSTQNASDDEIRSLGQIFEAFKERKPEDHVSEYSEVNLNFHKHIIRMSGCQLLIDQTDDLFIHMRGIRKVTISQDNRAQRSIVDHMKIIAAIADRDADLAERLVREHTFGLADHVRKYGNFLS